MEYSDTRGNELLDMIASLDLVIVNWENTSTFRRADACESIIGLTFATQRVARVTSDWSVLEEYKASSHPYISYSINNLWEKPPIIPERRIKKIT
ncbi:unnamed protein product [Parnassius apollo]|uniref:(apollo) hypothetical protein n=1 Tax=Parnassius apollo TaxID=110799 RepID=A0A8S3XXT2_PARAO|nr:unnamed protein product [Parnassius apollo]